MDKPSLPDLEGYFEPVQPRGPRLIEPQPVQGAIAEQQLRKTYWRLSFQRVQFGKYQDKPACLLVLEARFAPEDRKRHRFTKVRIGLEFEGEETSDIQVQQFAPEWARGVTVPEIHTSNWAIRSKISLSLTPIPVTIDLVDGKYGHKKSYQINKTAIMQGVVKFGQGVLWNLNEAKEEGIPLRIPSLVVLVTKANETDKPFKLKVKFSINASIALSLNPQRSSIFAKPVEPVLLDDTMQLIPTGDAVDPDFTSLEVERLTRTDFSDDV